MDNFEEFVKSKEQETATDFKPEREIQRFQDSVENFYKSIEKYLAPYQSIKTSYMQTDLSEQDLGTYPIREMIIKLGRDQVTLSPMGTMLIGAHGRIDMKGPRELVPIVLARPGGPKVTVNIVSAGVTKTPPTDVIPYEDYVWQFMVRTPRSHFIEVSEDSFKDTLMKVMGR